ncbi:hypothetical protein [Cerasicoccus maritimus]|uniref:hypothetical protein n=1 Tax=Cerasicoccus maritimus TaxID=490089 RepID=UPI0028526767|nr:hypothetical protein [Cerasicoccus maritimus]
MKTVLIALLFSTTAFAQSHLSPHFPAGATDLVPMKMNRTQPTNYLPANTAKLSGYFTEPTQPNSVQSYPSQQPIRFLIEEPVYTPDNQIESRWVPNQEMARLLKFRGPNNYLF